MAERELEVVVVAKVRSDEKMEERGGRGKEVDGEEGCEKSGDEDQEWKALEGGMEVMSVRRRVKNSGSGGVGGVYGERKEKERRAGTKSCGDA